MKNRLMSLFIAFCFLLTAGSAAAQFGLKKKKEEKPPEKKQEEPAPAAKPVSAETMKDITWADNGISFQVPSNWEQLTLERDFASHMLMPPDDSAGLSVNISRLGKDFPAQVSMKANRDDAMKKKDSGEVTTVEDVTLGKAKGLMYIEAAPASPDDVRRLTWIGFQKRGGWNQVTIHLSSKGGAFANHEATFRKLLATFKIESE